MPLTQQRVDWLPCAAPPDGRRQTSVDHNSPPPAVAPYRSLARSAIAQGSKAASSQLGGEDGASAAAAKTRCVAHTPSATLPAMTPQQIVLRAATTEDASFIVEMARHACVIEDRPLPHPDDDEVLEMLPPTGWRRLLPPITRAHPSVPCGPTTATHHCTATPRGRPCPNCASQWHQGTAGPASVPCCSTRSSPPLQETTTRCDQRPHPQSRQTPLRTQRVPRRRPRQRPARARNDQRLTLKRNRFRLPMRTCAADMGSDRKTSGDRHLWWPGCRFSNWMAKVDASSCAFACFSRRWRSRFSHPSGGNWNDTAVQDRTFKSTVRNPIIEPSRPRIITV